MRKNFLHSFIERIVIKDEEARLIYRPPIQDEGLCLSETLRGDFLSIGFGILDIEENLFKIDIPIRDTFIPIEIDLSSLDIRKIERFGFFINKNLSKQVVLQIDKEDYVESLLTTASELLRK